MLRAMDSLSRLFGSPARLKLLRLFLLNSNDVFTVADVAIRARIGKEAVRREVAALVAAKVLKKRGSGPSASYTTDTRFTHHEALKGFLRATSVLPDSAIVEGLRRAGAPRLIILSGLFTGSLEPKADILIVGDNLDERALSLAIRALEAELGRELRYASFATPEFRYRMGVYDRLLRDILDYPHRAIVDKLGL